MDKERQAFKEMMEEVWEQMLQIEEARIQYLEDIEDEE